MNRLVALIVVVSAISGCSTYAAHRYSISADNVTALRELGGKTINVGPFASTPPGQKEITCRAVGPIKTPDDEPFSDFVRKALIDELKIANAYSANAPVTLTGTLNRIDFDSSNGTWDLSLTVLSSNGNSMTATEQYTYTTSYFGETACNQTAQALMPAVQNLIGKLVRGPQFKALVN